MVVYAVLPAIMESDGYADGKSLCVKMMVIVIIVMVREVTVVGKPAAGCVLSSGTLARSHTRPGPSVWARVEVRGGVFKFLYQMQKEEAFRCYECFSEYADVIRVSGEGCPDPRGT
jgi:hypothetical protein